MTTWRLRYIAGAASTSDIQVTASASTNLGELSVALASAGLGSGPIYINGKPTQPTQTLQDIELVHGDVLSPSDALGNRPRRQPGRYVVAVSGPEAGRWAPLPRGGEVIVGRSPGVHFQLNDSLVSGRHLRIRADAAGAVTIEDLESSNGSFLEGKELTETTAIVPSQYAQVGATVLTLVDIEPGDLHELSAPREGAHAFQRQFRPALPPLPAQLVPPEPPAEKEDDRGRLWVQILLPMVSGLAFAIYSRRWIFLLMVALAPLLMGGYQFWRKTRERRRHEAKVRAYEASLQQHRTALANAQAMEKHRRRQAAVVGGEAVLMAQVAHRRLWEREGGDADYLEVCIGLAAQASAVRASKDRDSETEQLWGIPLGVSIRETGSLLVSGEQRRARAVGRSMILGLAATHSPRDVHISVLTTDDRSNDWNWVRWLPHTFVGQSASSVYTTAEQRDSVMANLVQRIDTWEGDAPANVHLVFVDGAHVVDGGLLTSVLRRGSRAGVHGIVLDERITPEGVRGTLKLGAMPDEGTFTSSTHAQTEGILTAELATSWAESAAMAMAGLQPASAGDTSTVAAEVHLVDMLAQGSVTSDWVRQRWQGSPRESVVVGIAGRTAVEVDIVRHGPHAIVGGATRSGKTEFLLTWLTSLCLHNSPDDLAILVADFKGGVDHVQTARLPHVVSLSTNKDIRAFERTLIMLEAEIKRREDLFASVGTSNIEAYRVARKRESDLMPVPRLLVVVDEFSELRQTDRDGGGGYMGRLESVARVGAGLGIHLVLVTQNFAGGQLPEQIESQIGLGVCFRVEDGSHSKVVLRSPVSSGIPADRPGRAWARLRGLDLQEFQSARVAGRRRDVDASAADVQIERVPFSSVASAAPDLASGAVPHDQTDLATLLAVINEAAAGHKPPVPWPGELSPDTSLASVISRATTAGMSGPVLGLADAPHSQAQLPAVLTTNDEQILVVGSNPTEVGEALLTLAVSESLAGPPDALHLYGIDLESNWLQPLSGLPHTGAVACLNDDIALRIVRRLRSEAERRRALFDQLGVNDLAGYRRATGENLPRVRLYVNGADRLQGSSESDVSALMRPVGALVADTTGTGIGVVLGGGPALVGRRITQRVRRRFVSSLAEAATYQAVGVPKSAAIDLAEPGRVYDTTLQQVVQLGRLGSGANTAHEVIEALGQAMASAFVRYPRDGFPQPMPEVRWPLPWARLDQSSLRVPAGYGAALPVAVDSDTARWHWLDVAEEGPLLAIGGPARSGRSAALVSLAELARMLGWAVQMVAPNRRSPLHRLTEQAHADIAAFEPALMRPTVYLIDDANRLGSDDTLEKILEESTKPFLVAITGPESMFERKTGVLRGTPDLQAAVTLAATGSAAIGIARLPDHLRADVRPGKGVLWRAGDVSGVHVPLHPSVETLDRVT